MSEGFRLTVDSAEFARVMTNALAFFPARGIVDTAQLRVWPDKIESTGTDTYTLGRDYCEATNFQSVGTEFPVRIELDREGWQAIEKNARFDRKGFGILEYRPGDCLTFYPQGDNDKAEIATAKDMTGQGTPFKIEGDEMSRTILWEMCDVLLTRLEEIPGEIRCFDPTLFGRFGKVKGHKGTDKVVDFCWQDDMRPMLAKVGSTFVGAIMPINREAREGDELWET